MFNKILKRLPAVGICFSFVLLLAAPVLAVNPSLELVSVNSTQTGTGNRDSFGQVMTPDGRYVAFVSNADDLVANDTNNASDVFMRDRQTGTTTLVSINSAGTGTGNADSKSPSISDDGRYVAFVSNASDILPIDPSGVSDVFVRDLVLGTTTLVSVHYAGTISGNNDSRYAKISANGRFVVFASIATDIVPNDANGTLQDIFVRDLQAGVTRLVSVNSAGTATGNNGSNIETSNGISAISADGRYVAFDSSANDLVTNDTNTVYDVFVRDVQAGTTRLVSVNSAGTASGNNGSFGGFISLDGRYVSFVSNASNLVANDGNNLHQDAFRRDLTSGTTTQVSVNQSGTAGGNGDSGAGIMTPDGRYLVFASTASNLTQNGVANVNLFRRDMQTGVTTLISFNSSGNGGGNNSSSAAAVSNDGRYVAFNSSASDLVSNDINGSGTDAFVRDLQANTTKLMSANIAGTGSGDAGASAPSISADGRYAAFASNASDLVLNDFNISFNDVFVFDTQQVVPADQLRFSVSTSTVSESAGLATITVNRVGGTAGTISTNYATGGGSAMPGSDYTAVNGTLTFAPGVSSQSFTIPILEDSVNEATESVNLSLSNSSSNAVLRIQDNDALPSLSINDVSVVEGNGGYTYATFTVTRTPASEQRTTVVVGPSPNTALPWQDYVPGNTTVTFLPGETTKTVSVAVIGELAYEPDEVFDMNLVSPVNAVLDDWRGTGTIINDDSNVGISIEDASVTEGDDGTLNMGFVVRLSAASFQPVSYTYGVTGGGTATEGQDFTGVFGGDSFFAGSTTRHVVVPIRGDLLDEPDETVMVSIGNASNGAIITRALAVGTIIDNDPEPSLSINDIRVTEPRAGTYTATFTASLSAPSGKPVTVNYWMSDGTANAFADYQPPIGSVPVTFSPGQTSKPIAVLINADSLQEPAETFYLNLGNPLNASLARTQSVCTITDYHSRVGADFDGDSKTDLSVFRPSNGTWYITHSADNSFRGEPFGLSTDSLAPGDYDGDGKTDIAVFRPSTGYWYIMNSSNNSVSFKQFGQTGDLPSPGDYDGDGKSDLALYRPSNNYFYYLYSADNSFHFQQWGASGDLPLLGDYDGDGQTDLAIFRPSVNTFYVLKSFDGGVIGQQFGQSGDKPIAADFDGDGKTDIAIYRPSTGSWYSINSSDNSSRGIAWGASGDLPAAGDYDGDGKWDVAVFRPSTGTFYILQSTTNNLRADQFGASGDMPVPAAFIP